MLLSSPADFLFKTLCLKKNLKEYHKSVSQYGRLVGPDFGSNCFKVVSRRHLLLAKKPVEPGTLL